MGVGEEEGGGGDCEGCAGGGGVKGGYGWGWGGGVSFFPLAGGGLGRVLGWGRGGEGEGLLPMHSTMPVNMVVMGFGRGFMVVGSLELVRSKWKRIWTSAAAGQLVTIHSP